MPEKILVVDDDRVALGNLCQFLNEEGYEVEYAADGLQALRLLEENTFHLVLSDIFMPKMDGFRLLDQVRSRFANTPIILMTADFTLGAPAALYRRADDYLVKPLDLEKLLHKVRAVLDEHKRYSYFENDSAPRTQKSNRRRF
jgi:DNA-binding response OmpR family regulator